MKKNLRFNLKMLLLCMALIASWLAWKVNSVREQEQASKFIRSKHGFIGYDFEYDVRAFRRKNPVPPTDPKWIERMGISWFHKIVWVELRGIPVDDETIREIGNLRNLRGLFISGYEKPTPDIHGVKYTPPSLTNHGLWQLGKFKQLQRLYIDVGAAEFRKSGLWRNLEKLEQLTLQSARDSHMKYIAEVPNLKRLELWGDVSDNGLLRLANMQTLLELDVPARTVSQATRQQLKAANPNLRILDQSTDSWQWQPYYQNVR